MKDNFSEQSNLYKTFRPTYSTELFDFLLDLIPEKKRARYCGTGNGQIATVLANHFKQVHATDISWQQLDQTPCHPNIENSVQQSEY